MTSEVPFPLAVLSLPQCWVVLGTSVSAAESVWLLTSTSSVAGPESFLGEKLNPSELKLWEPTTGRSWGVMDPACPLLEIGTVFNNANIWGNVQPDGAPASVAWDLTSPRLQIGCPPSPC